MRGYERALKNKVKAVLDKEFLQTCLLYNLTPNFVKFKTACSQFNKSHLYRKFQRSILHFELRQKKNKIRILNRALICDSQLINSKLVQLNSTDLLSQWTILVQMRTFHFLSTKKIVHQKKLNSLGFYKLNFSTEHLLYNLSSSELSAKQEYLLRNGPDYKLPVTKTDFTDVEVESEKMLRFLSSERNTIPVTEFTRKMRRSLESYSTTIRMISAESQSALAALKEIKKNDSIVVVKSDKVNSTVVMDKNDYFRRSEMFLESSLFEVTENFNMKKFNSLLYYLKKEKKLGNLSDSDYDKMKPEGDKDPVAYFLPKMHKEDSRSNLKMRPIVSMIHSFNYKLSQFLSDLIRASMLPDNQYVVKDVYQFVDRLKTIKISGEEMMVTFDIESLYPSIPLKEVCDKIVECLAKKSQISRESLVKLLGFCTNEYCFKFGDRYFKQVNGVSMGTPIAPVVSEVFLEEIDRKISQIQSVNCYFRYVDDCFAIVKRSDFDEIVKTMNGLHKNLRFTSEVEKENKCHFLDATIERIEDEFRTYVFRKPTKPMVVARYECNQPFTVKRNTVKNMVIRAKKICSTNELFTSELQVIEKILLNSGYPLELVRRLLKMSLRPRLVYFGPAKKIVYFGLEYRGKSTDVFARSLKRNFKKFAPGYCQLRIYYKRSPSLINSLSFKSKPRTCSSMNGVYHIDCLGCELCYIGQTKRQLKTRIYEHKRDKNVNEKSAMYDHFRNTAHVMNYDSAVVLKHESSDFKRKILESIYIRDSNVIEGNKASFELSLRK